MIQGLHLLQFLLEVFILSLDHDLPALGFFKLLINLFDLFLLLLLEVKHGPLELREAQFFLGYSTVGHVGILLELNSSCLQGLLLFVHDHHVSGYLHIEISCCSSILLCHFNVMLGLGDILFQHLLFDEGGHEFVFRCGQGSLLFQNSGLQLFNLVTRLHLVISKIPLMLIQAIALLHLSINTQLLDVVCFLGGFSNLKAHHVPEIGFLPQPLLRSL
mmetsp:Transcript_6851/g.11060  ORF Transcript_6851/g.11060 Transcript_6851/m.11060 type:complete len:217 (+) Transcript_6851:674-1324(+)